MYRYITGSVEAEKIKLSTDVAGAAGSHDDVVLKLQFDSMWDGLTITALWINSHGENPTYTLITLDSNDEAEILIPAPPKAYAGDIILCIKGVTVEDEVETRATVSASTKMRVLPSLYAEDAILPEDISASLADQVRAEMAVIDAKIGDLDDLETTYKDDLVGAINEANQNGGGGGTTDYNNLINKPQIGGTTLSGNKSASDLGLEATTNKVTSITNASTNTQYPSAKAVYDLVMGAMGGEY